MPWSAVGGIETFHATKPRTDAQEALKDGIAAAKANYQDRMAASKREVRARVSCLVVLCVPV